MTAIAQTNPRVVLGTYQEILLEFQKDGIKVQLAKGKSSRFFYVNRSSRVNTVKSRFKTLERAEEVYKKKVNDLSTLNNALLSTLYTPSPSLHFLLTEFKIIAIVNPSSAAKQAFLVQYDHDNFANRHSRLREMIIEGKINSVTDLIDYCKPVPGQNSMMYGLELVPTRLERYL